jgi:two-component system sensor histidine kinase TctE
MAETSRSGNSLRVSLTRRLALALAVIGVFGTIVAYVLGAKYANLAYDQALLDDVATLASQVSVDDAGVIQVNLPTAALKWLLADEGEVVLYRVTDLRSGAIVVANGELGTIPADPDISGQSAYRDFTNGDRSLRVGYTRLVLDPGDVSALIEIGETTGKRDRMTRRILAGTALFMATVVAVAVTLVWRGVATALAPLKLIEAEASRRSGTELTPLDPLHGPEEVRGLIEAVNRLMARVSSVMESQSHFIANAAHQLRTPLAGLRLQAQLASKATRPEAMRASLAEVEASAARAAHLIDQILVLSRAEAAETAASDQTIDLAIIARQVIERNLALADRRNIDLGYEGGADNLEVLGNEVLFAELLGNLVDNALRYGREGGRVTVEAREVGDDVVLAVSDEGAGFDAVDLERVFTRFYRPDSSPTGGAGLGLAIVREIAERYQGRLTLESEPGKGSRFELRFSGIGAQPS